MRKYLLLMLLPLSAQANEFYVRDDLANMVDDVVRKHDFKINIHDMRPKYVSIDRVDGMDVCAPQARQKVEKLQAAFSKHPKLYRTSSVHGIYLRQRNGKLSYTPLNTSWGRIDKSDCKHISVSVK